MIRASIRRKTVPPYPTLQESFGFLQVDLRNPPKQGSSDSAPLSQGSFPHAEPLDREDKAALPPLGNSSFMHTARPDSGLSTCCPQERQVFRSSHSPFLSLKHAQEKDPCTAIASLSLNIRGSKFATSKFLVEEASISPSSFVTSL